ncbi:hypothetical protein QNJ99_18790 [Bradyrhizobium elkanii]|nr:hypothetical protein QNJ99_18790 [Bradyrhizobium elkanii]
MRAEHDGLDVLVANRSFGCIDKASAIRMLDIRQVRNRRTAAVTEEVNAVPVEAIL